MSLIEVLHANGPAAERGSQMNLYAFLIGAWDAEVLVHAPTGTVRGSAEIHADWVLEGRALQDVWMIPRRRDRKADAPPLALAGNWYGTTLRIYDVSLQAWRIHWLDPATQRFMQQIGRADGDDIVQLGHEPDGSLTRWRFTEIRGDSFHWWGERSVNGGLSWALGVEVLARRNS
jgi:hypothetical protein